MVEKGKKEKIFVQHVEGLSEMFGITPKWDKDHPKLSPEESIDQIKNDERFKEFEIVSTPIGPKTKEEQERYNTWEKILQNIPITFREMSDEEFFGRGFKRK